MTDKQPIQADGEGTTPHDPDGSGEVASRRDSSGESQGGAYPNPHTGKEGGHFKGGQSERDYHGGNQAGDEKDGPQPNAPSTE